MRPDKEVKPNADTRERKNGLLHPKSYLWVINEVFDGGLKDIPDPLYGLYRRACSAWRTYPHYEGLRAWEIKRFQKLLDEILARGDSSEHSLHRVRSTSDSASPHRDAKEEEETERIESSEHPQ